MCSEVRCQVPLQQQNNWSCTEHILQISLFGDINLGYNSITAEVQGSLSMHLRGTRFSPLYRSIHVAIEKHMAGKKSFEGHELCRIWEALCFSFWEAPGSQVMQCPLLRWLHLTLTPQREQPGLTCFKGDILADANSLGIAWRKQLYCKELTPWLPSIFLSINCDEQWAASPDPTVSSMEQVTDHMERNKLPLHTQGIYPAFFARVS